MIQMAATSLQSEYKTLFNATSHTSPSAEADLNSLRNYLKVQQLQTYKFDRDNNQYATLVRDLLAVGAEYADKLSAFRNFMYTHCKVTNLGIDEGPVMTGLTDDASPNDEDVADCDLSHNGSESLMAEDMVFDGDNSPFMLDEDEYPPGTDIGDFIAMTKEIVDEFSRYE
jgi:hypothetical protein